MSAMFPRKRRKRTIITAEQLLKLESLFKQEQWPGREKKEELAREIEMSTHFVNIWFQNKRSRVKKLAQEEEEIEAMRKRLLQATADDSKQSPCIAPRCETQDRPIDLAQRAVASADHSSAPDQECPASSNPSIPASSLPINSPQVAFGNAAVLLPNTSKTKSSTSVILATITHQAKKVPGPGDKVSASVPLLRTHNSSDSTTRSMTRSQIKPTFWKPDKVLEGLHRVAPAHVNDRVIYGTNIAGNIRSGFHHSPRHAPLGHSLSVSNCSSSLATTTAPAKSSQLPHGFMPDVTSFIQHTQTSESSNIESSDQLTSRPRNGKNQRPLLPRLDATDLRSVKKMPVAESPSERTGSRAPTLLRCLILMMALSEQTGAAFGLKPADFDLAFCASAYGVKVAGLKILQYDNKTGFSVSKPARKKKRKKEKEKGKETNKKKSAKK
ncbi:uncharacterized protein [Diadema setosum]|uniref:uncharacterized protein n=1 Tax=Diadema setosum TaxID=31175 RepID=UPI003B3A7BEE